MQASPVEWLKGLVDALHWPTATVTAFWLGRKYKEFESRITKGEKGMSDLLTRHMPHLHSALARVETKLDSVVTAVLSN